MGAFLFLWEQGLLMALIASLGGCFIRQSTEYKAGKSIRWQVLVIDDFIALFLGFYSFWYVIEDFKPSLVNACIINIIVGYLGSKVIEISKNILLKRARIYFDAGGKNE